MKKYIFLLGIGSVLFFGRLTAQVKISDKLERIDYAEVDGALMQMQSKDSNKGIRLPYVVLDDMERYKLGGIDRDVYDSAAGMMVYHLGNDTITVSANALLKQAGVFVWNAAKWKQAGGGSIPGKPLPANAVNGDANNYANQYDLKIADADNALYMAVDNNNAVNGAYIQAGHSDPGSASGTANIVINPFGGSVGIGTASPAQKLEVNGTTRTQKLDVIDTTQTKHLKIKNLASTGQRNLAINPDGTVTTNVLSSWVEFGTTSPPLLANQAYQVEIAALSSVAVNPAPSFALLFNVSTAGNISYQSQSTVVAGGNCVGGAGYNGIQSGNGTSTIVVRTKACGNVGTLTLSYNAITRVITTSHTGYPNRTRKGRIKTDGFYY